MKALIIFVPLIIAVIFMYVQKANAAMQRKLDEHKRG